MEIRENVSLKHLNTFGVDASVKYYAEIRDQDDIAALLDWKAQHDMPALLLGGGSNLLFRQNYDGLVAKICLPGKDIAERDGEHVYVSAAGGENWHEFVRWTVSQGLAGLENLSLIPGTVGAAPIQNIGAYGVELADCFYSLQAVDLDTAEVFEYHKSACNFAYRDSIFKSQKRDKLLITSVTFALTPESRQTRWNIDYAGVREALQGREPGAALISDVVIALRQSKLPDPAVVGNAGSFFKNPLLSVEKWEDLKAENPDVPGWKQADGSIKTSAAWLIDQCGFKGRREGDAGVSEKHALVLVNHGKASGAQLWALAREIMTTVEDRFEITLQAEPRVL